MPGNNYLNFWGRNELLRSEPVQDFIKARPTYIIRYGLAIIFLILLSTVLASWFVHYPEIITVKAVLTSANKPESIVAKTDSRIVRLLVAQNEKVKRGDVIAYLESNANHPQAIELAHIIDTACLLLENNNHKELFTLIRDHLNKPLFTGPLQQSLQTFKEVYKHHSSNAAQVTEAVFILKNDIEKWKDQHVIVAPIDGQIVFTGLIRDNQLVTPQKPIGYLLPDNMPTYGEMTVSQKDLHKIKIGQPVLLKLYAYPYLSYGVVKGHIDFISEVPNDSGFTARISIPQRLLTNTNKELKFRMGLTARAEIITRNMRLTEYLLLNLKRISIAK